MPTQHITRTTRRFGLVAALALTAALTATLTTAGTAYAHAEVTADKPQALAEDVTLSFISEAESSSAGFTQLRVVLPQGIAPDDVSLADGPEGWKLKTVQDGYTVEGPALPAGTDAEHKIKVRQLPESNEIAFKTVETYSDGEVSRWIEIPSGAEEPQQPAPVLKLKAAAPGAAPTSPSPATSAPPSATDSAPSSTETPGPKDTAQENTAQEDTAQEDDGSLPVPLIGVGVAVLLGLGAGGWWLARRQKTNSP
ncbi:DUF1775 domain-containing protein [Streptomyces sp. JV176]|uniref:DUF1775 domain-containing protein n=1 Tax=Streptomyces sp. JV176 TaxID=858630 RepID=UPI002E7A9775|nr:DUF1775 domain-containing protein [Streptomyces sp. JV176]MEE1798428.1 DUF1775 domain-containing protein [Streptomyces sp. JV176]